MNILRVTSKLYPYTIGGIGLHAHHMSKIQTEMGHDVTVFTRKQSDKPTLGKRNTYKIKQFEPEMEIFGNPLTFDMLEELYHNQSKFDIMHAHSHLFFSTNLSALVKKIKDEVPLVITNHGLISQTPPRWISLAYVNTVGLLTLRQADKIITYTKDEKKELEKIGVNPEHIEVIHNGINIDMFKKKENVKTKNQILWVGRYLPGKGVSYLLKAFKKVVEENSNFKLLMIGDGPLRDDMVKLARSLGIFNNIEMKKFVPNKEMPKYYSESKIFALSSIDEGVPRTVLEALSCETPVVCTNLPQLTDIVQNCGYIVSKENPKELGEKIIGLINDEEKRREMGRKGRKKIKEKYSWRDTVKQTIEFYKKIENNF